MAEIDQARFKLVRAREQFHALGQDILTYFKKTPYVLRSEVDEQAEEIILYADVSELPDPYLNTKVGEIAQAVRSSVNYLACALVKKGGGTITRQTQFPIYDEKGKLPDAKHAMVKGMSDAAFMFVERLQPYHRQTPAEHPLYCLRKLSNPDKHTSIEEPILWPEELHVTFRKLYGREVRANVKHFTKEPLKDGLLIARLEATTPIWPSFDVEMDAYLKCAMLFDDKWRPSDLQRVIDFVETDVIERGARLL